MTKPTPTLRSVIISWILWFLALTLLLLIGPLIRETMGQEPSQKNVKQVQIVQIQAQLNYLDDRFRKEMKGYVTERERLVRTIQTLSKEIQAITKAEKEEVKDEKDSTDQLQD